MVARTWRLEISGDLLVFPGNYCYLSGPPTQVAAMQGSPETNGSNVPLIFPGPHWIRPGKYGQPAEIVDIVPTLTHLLNLRHPDGSEGRVRHEIFRKSPSPRP